MSLNEGSTERVGVDGKNRESRFVGAGSRPYMVTPQLGSTSFYYLGTIESYPYVRPVSNVRRQSLRLYKGSFLGLLLLPQHHAQLSLHELFNMTPSPGVNATTLPGLAPITETNKAGILWIASLLSAIYALLSILVRWYQKRKCFGIDDWICLAATVRRSSLPLGGAVLIFTNDRSWAWAPSSPFTLRSPKD